jgi:hypothetical protein
MRKNRVLTVIMAALACAAALAACGGKGSGGSGTASGDVAQAAGKAAEAVVKAAENPVTDFQYGLTEDGKGVVIYKFLRDYANAERDEAVIIPEEIEGFPVVEISAKAFRGADAYDVPEQGYFLGSVVIPAGVKRIGDSAFYHCKDLTSVTIQGTGVAIRDAAFGGCEKLRELQIPEGDKVLVPEDVTISNDYVAEGKYGFGGCGSLPLATRAKLKEMGFNF